MTEKSWKDELAKLKEQREAKLQQIEKLKHEVVELTEIIKAFEPLAERLDHVWVTHPGDPTMARLHDFAGMSIKAAARRLIQAKGPQETAELVNALVAGGKATKSKKFSASVYSTLHEAAEFYRTKDRKWALREEKER